MMNRIKKSEKYFKNSEKLKITRENPKNIENSKKICFKNLWQNYGKI
jgi:hypothetical protein